MKLLSIALCTFLLLTTAFNPVQAEEPSLEKYAALAAAEQFLLLLDQGKYEKSWGSAAELFRKSANKQQWEGRVGHLRD